MCLNAHETLASFSMCDAKFTREITHRKGDSLCVPYMDEASQPLMDEHIGEGGIIQIGNGFWVSAGNHHFKDICM